MDNVVLSKKVSQALLQRKPVLALESSILSQGMPYPESYEFAKEAESLCHKSKITPAIIAILKGVVYVGLSEEQLKFICRENSIKKVSKRELGVAIVKKWNCSTTVSSTLYIAHACGIKVFSTGGIGGVHRGQPSSFDISQDIKSLSETPLIVITAGPKAVLDINKTVEHLETNEITSLGYKTSEYPSFYSINSGVFGLEKIESVNEIVKTYLNNKAFGLPSSVSPIFILYGWKPPSSIHRRRSAWFVGPLPVTLPNIAAIPIPVTIIDDMFCLPMYSALMVSKAARSLSK